MMRLAVVVVLLLAVLVAPASAQTPGLRYTLTYQYDGEVVVPVTDVATVPFRFKATCETGATGPGPEPVQYEFGVTTDASYAVATVEPATALLELPPQECAAGKERVVHGNVTITMSKEAPAGETADVVLAATHGGEEVVSVTWATAIGTYHNVQARFDSTIRKAAQGMDVPLRLTVENFGNGAMTPRFAVGDDSSNKLNVTLPEPRSVPAGATTTFNMTVLTPSGALYENRQDTVVVSIVPVSDVDRSTADEIQRSVLIQTQGSVVDEAPPVAMMPTVLLLGLAAWAARRR